MDDQQLWQLNDDKTELIITIHTKTSQNQHIAIHIGDSQWRAAKESGSFIWLDM